MAKDTFSFRLSGDLRRRLWDAAEADHRPVGDWLRLLIERELGSREAVALERARMVGGDLVWEQGGVASRVRSE